MTELDIRGIHPRVRGKKRKMAEMLCNPDLKMSVSEMCKEVGVSRQTFYNWQGDSDFNGYVEYLLENFTESELPAAWKSLVRKMKTGNVEALKLFFELKGKLKKEVNVNGGVVIIAGDDELED